MKIRKMSTIEFINTFGTEEQKEEAKQKTFSSDSGTKQIEICLDILENEDFPEDTKVNIPDVDYLGITLATLL